MSTAIFQIYVGLNALIVVSWLALLFSERSLEADAGAADAQSLSRVGRLMLLLSAALPATVVAMTETGWVPASAQVFEPLTAGGAAAASALGQATRAAFLQVSPGQGAALSGVLTALADAPARHLALGVAALGLLVTLGRLALGWVRMGRAVGQASRIASVGKVRVVAVAGLNVPFSVWRPGRAWVALPEAMLGSGDDPDAWRLAMAHELQHHRQGDTQWLYPLALLKGACCWNPFAHAFVAQLRDLAELSCDQALLRRGISKRRYARCLLWVAEHASQAQDGLLLAHALYTGMAGRKRALTRRMNLMIRFNTENTSRRPGLMTLAAALPVMLAGAIFTAQAGAGSSYDAEQATAVVEASQGSNFPLTLAPPVVEALNTFATVDKANTWLSEGLERLPALEGRLSQPFIDRGLPTELLAMTLAESGVQNLTPDVNIRAGGPGSAGIWQFIPQTARTYGLTVDDTLDERLDIDKESQAAAQLLADLHARYGDWGLAIAAYNAGPRSVDRAVEAGGTRDVYALISAGHLPRYAAQVMACAIARQDPTVAGLRSR